MRLQYEIATIGGTAQMRAAFRGIEKEAQASNKRMASDAQRTAASSAKLASGPMFGPGRKEQMAAIREREKAAIASAKSELRARLAGEKELDRARTSLDKQRARALMQQFREQERTERQAIAARKSSLASIGRGVAGGVGRGVGKTLKLGGAALGIAGGFAVAQSLSEEAEIRRRASALANQAGNPALKGQLVNESTQVKGFTGSETLGALGAFVGKTGDLESARAAIQSIGKLSLATNSDFETMGETAGNAFNVIADRIKDPKKRLEELNKVLAGWAGQGNIGTVELKDLAQFGGRLGGATRKFAGDPADLLLKTGAIAQAAARGGGAADAAEATEAVMRFAADLTKHPAQKALGGLGVNVFADKNKTKLRDPAEILADIMVKTKGNLVLGEDILNAQSGKALGGLSDVFTQAEAQKKGSGRAAIMAEFDRYNKAALTPGDVAAQSNSRLEDPDLQFKEALKEFNVAVGRELLPAVTKLVPEFSKLVPKVAEASNAIASIVGWAAENPFEGLAALFAANIATEVASAGISSALSSGVTSTVTALGSLSAASLGTAGAFAAAAAAVGAAIYENSQLKNETGGKGILDVADEYFLQGKDLKSIADENLDKQAKAEAAARVQAPGTVALNPRGAVTPGSAATNGMAAPAASPATPGGSGAQDLKDAAAALKAAAAAMPKDGKGGVPPGARTAPIVSPARG